MAHYFDNETSLDQPHWVEFQINGKDFRLESNAGVFSRDKLDTGTRILLETVLEKQSPVTSVLDLGSGIGVVGVVLASLWNCKVTAIDTNQRACNLTEKNLESIHADYQVFNQDGLQDLKEKFPLILLNPPIRAGKETIYRLFKESVDHLDEGGALWVVIRKQHGAQSAMDYLNSIAEAKRIARDKGFWVLKVTGK